MNPRTHKRTVAGPAGDLECAIDAPAGAARGLAVVCHPHPQHGGTMDNKVVVTLARAHLQCGWRVARFNFRGIGGSAGAWDEGRGEIDDAIAVARTLRVAPANDTWVAGTGAEPPPGDATNTPRRSPGRVTVISAGTSGPLMR